MSFKQNDTITLSNYEEYFMLYVDNELDEAGKGAVENFAARHPHLAEELDMLMSTKLPFDALPFSGKEDLLSPAMKGNTVDENLLLYIDGELPAAEMAGVEQKIKADADYALQHLLLLQTKLDAGEKLPYPNKKELYRHVEKVRVFGYWMRYAAAVVLLLFGAWFFLLKQNTTLVIPADLAANEGKKNPGIIKQPTPVEQTTAQGSPVKNGPALVANGTKQLPQKTQRPTEQKAATTENNPPAQAPLPDETGVAQKSREIIRFDADRFTAPAEIGDAVALNKTIARTNVTSALDERTTPYEGDEKAAGFDPDFKDTKKTPARGFFRKVSRFIERRTGIGTVNDDNELLIGAVALKLK